MNIKMERNKIITVCDNCQVEIVKEQPMFIIQIDSIEEMYLCEDCGKELRVKLSDEHTKFVDLKK